MNYVYTTKWMFAQYIHTNTHTHTQTNTASWNMDMIYASNMFEPRKSIKILIGKILIGSRANANRQIRNYNRLRALSRWDYMYSMNIKSGSSLFRFHEKGRNNNNNNPTLVLIDCQHPFLLRNGVTTPLSTNISMIRRKKIR
jgi:hypothetical protein